MHDEDKQKYKMMGERIEAHKQGEIDLMTLTSDLIFLRDDIEQMDSKWEEDFTSELINLSSIYTYPEYHSNTKIVELLRDTLFKLHTLIEQI